MAPSGKTLRGSLGLSIHRLFLKNTEIDSPFTCVKTKTCVSRGTHL